MNQSPSRQSSTPCGAQPRQRPGNRLRRESRARRPAPRTQSLAAALLHWFRTHARDLPWRRTRDPYAIWISEIMLQQTQVATVIPYFERWLRTLPDLDSLARASEDQVLRLWSGLGYYRRARHLHQAARELVQRGGPHWPSTPAQWLELPGVGRYTAGAICSIAFNCPTPILDGNVARVLTRLRGQRRLPASTKSRNQLWSLASTLVRAAAALPDPRRENCSHLNQSLMELGAILCTPKDPNCPQCPLRYWCIAKASGHPACFAAPRPRPAPRDTRWIVYLHRRRDRYLVCRRPARSWNAGLWEFPTREQLPAAPRPFPPDGPDTPRDQVFTLTHTITQHRIRVSVRLRPPPASLLEHAQTQWLPLAAIADLPLGGLHRKILSRLRLPTSPKRAPRQHVTGPP